MPTTTEQIAEQLRSIITGEVSTLQADRATFSHDTSIFEITPSLIVYPKNKEDVSEVVRLIHKRKSEGEDISITGRSAGTDMTGGPLTSSIVMGFTKYMNHIGKIEGDHATTEPGVFYRDFEKETLKQGLILPSYPASRELCAIGGIINNNSGGERTLAYGKTERYVEELSVVLSDGSPVTFRKLSMEELAQKEAQQDLEGAIYRETHALIEKNYETIMAAKPKVTKNSAGYALWNVYDKEQGTFDLTKLIVGAQGTLGMVTEAKLKLVRPKEHRAMLIMFLTDLDDLPEIVHRVLARKPESFESYDDKTFALAVRFLPSMLKSMGLRKMFTLGFSFLPELWTVMTGGIPKLILMAEFAEETPEEAVAKAEDGMKALADLPIRTRIARTEAEEAKYWTVRRESFSLLRKNVHGLHASPFIDDFVVVPEKLPEFLPELNQLLKQYDLIYTIAGHVGDGNFHIIPLMNLADPKSHDIIMELSTKVYELIVKYGGSITGEHNDGIIRTPFLPMMYGEKICGLFADVKNIFDPLHILNPNKKVGGKMEDIAKHMITHS